MALSSRYLYICIVFSILADYLIKYNIPYNFNNAFFNFNKINIKTK